MSKNPSNPFSLESQVVLLTGGAGKFGRGLAHSIANAGATLILASRNVDALKAVAEEETQAGNKVAAEFLDQGNPETIAALRDLILERYGRIDGLVNNAVNRPMKELNDPLETWALSMKINATGLFEITRVLGEVMTRQGSGSIVNIGSIQGAVGVDPTLYEGTSMSTTPSPDYYFHKGGMINFSRYFASVYGQSGVRVNTLSPGGYFDNQPETFVTRYNAKTMLGRMADDEDLGGPTVFLLSRASKYITGTNLLVDGGYTAK